MEKSNRSEYKSLKQREFSDFYRSMFGQYEDDCELYSDDSEGDISLIDDSDYDNDTDSEKVYRDAIHKEYSSSTVEHLVHENASNLPSEHVGMLPYIGLEFNEQEVPVLLQSGSIINIVSVTCAKRMNFPVLPVSEHTQYTLRDIQFDSDLAVGEVHVSLTINGLQPFDLDAIVIDNHDQDITGGVPFMRQNKIVIDTVNDEIVVDGSTVISYWSQEDSTMSATSRSAVNACQQDNCRLTSVKLLTEDYPDLNMRPQLPGSKGPIFSNDGDDKQHVFDHQQYSDDQVCGKNITKYVYHSSCSDFMLKSNEDKEENELVCTGSVNIPAKLFDQIRSTQSHTSTQKQGFTENGDHEECIFTQTDVDCTDGNIEKEANAHIESPGYSTSSPPGISVTQSQQTVKILSCMQTVSEVMYPSLSPLIVGGSSSSEEITAYGNGGVATLMHQYEYIQTKDTMSMDKRDNEHAQCKQTVPKKHDTVEENDNVCAQYHGEKLEDEKDLSTCDIKTVDEHDNACPHDEKTVDEKVNLSLCDIKTVGENDNICAHDEMTVDEKDLSTCDIQTVNENDNICAIDEKLVNETDDLRTHIEKTVDEKDDVYAQYNNTEDEKDDVHAQYDNTDSEKDDLDSQDETTVYKKEFVYVQCNNTE